MLLLALGTGYYEEGLTPTCDCEGKLRPNPVGSKPDIGAYEINQQE